MKYIICYILLYVLFFGIFSCKDDVKIIEEKIPETTILPIKTDTEEVMVKLTESTTVNITKGAGEYVVYSTDETVATATVKGSVVTVNALTVGKADVVIVDKDQALKKITVLSYIGETKFDISDFNLKMKLGNATRFYFKVTQGNSGYQVGTDDTEIIDIENSGDDFILTAKKAGTASFKIIDCLGIETIVQVAITTTTIPYTAKELEEIKDNNEIRCFFNEKNTYRRWYDHVNQTKDGYDIIGWKNYRFYFKCYFKGNKDVGKKTDSKIERMTSTVEGKVVVSVDFEIIKNDGNKIWAIYSFVKDDKLNFGHFCFLVKSSSEGGDDEGEGW